eukprot:TRINITY_DN10659_c0_g2_i3.p1 TRINITY_DN10659_c0_g2~~TRINITY_DN10659_c0_g2_i3.p1  ORF type:complete len:375 (+),score=21.71 TRINITY_DN10659_c0_g2_i3:81-1205(+)
MAEPAKEPFEIVLKNGCCFTVKPHVGYRLTVTYAALQDGGDASLTIDGKVAAMVKEAGNGVVVRMRGRGGVFESRGGTFVVFMYWELYDAKQLYDDYETSDDEDLPTLGDKTYTWSGNPEFLGHSEVGGSPPKLVSVEDEPSARVISGSTQMEIDITPPRMMALVPSSSPERSASRSEDEGGYFVKIPTASPTLPTPGPVLTVTSIAQDQRVNVTERELPKPTVREVVRVSPKKEPVVKEIKEVKEVGKRMGGGVVPTKGVLKKRSRLIRVKPSPKMSPKAPPTTPKRRVIFNTRSPDIRFISPPLSAIHKAFSGGLLDLGVPLLPQNIKPSRHITPPDSKPSAQQQHAPKPIAHQPFLQSKVTPTAYRPTVIE